MRVAIIGGSGHWGTAVEGAKRHGATVVGVAQGSPDEKVDHVAAKCLETLGVAPEIYSDWKELLDRAKPDVVVANPFFHLNGAVTLECLQRRIPCYVEKPIATEMEEFYRIKRQWESDRSVPLLSMQELRYLPEFLAGHEFVSKGGIGQPLLLTAQKSYPLLQRAPFFRKRATYGGTIPWVGIHAFDWILWYAGSDITEIYARHSSLGNDGHDELETLCAIQFTLESGALAMANLDYLRSPKAGSWGDDRIRAVGDRGAIEVRGQKAYATPRDSETHELPLAQPRNIFQEFLASLEGQGAPLITTEECLRATEVSLWARQSADDGKPVQLPKP